MGRDLARCSTAQLRWIVNECMLQVHASLERCKTGCSGRTLPTGTSTEAEMGGEGHTT